MMGNNKQVKVFGWDGKAFAHVFIGKVPFININRFAHPRFLPDHVFEAPVLADIQEDRGKNISECVSSCPRYARGDIWHAIMDHIVFPENRVRVVGYLRCFKTPALVDAYVNNYGIRFHATYRCL